MSLRPEALDHLRRYLGSEIADAIRKDHQETIEFIEKKIDKLKDQVEAENQSGGNSGPYLAIIQALNEIRMKLA